MSMIKIAFDLEVALARNEAGFTKQAAPDLGQFVDKLKAVNWPWKKDEPSALSSWKPYAVGAGLGLGAYGLMRHQNLADAAKFPVLRKMQEASGGEMLREALPGYAEDLPWWKKQLRKLMFGPEIPLNEEGEFAKKFLGTDEKPKAIYRGTQGDIQHGTFDPSNAAVTPEELEKIRTSNSIFGNKFMEADFANKYAPGTMPHTVDVGELSSRHNLPYDPDEWEMAKKYRHLEAAMPTLEQFQSGDFVGPLTPKGVPSQNVARAQNTLSDAEAYLALIREKAKTEFGGKKFIIKPSGAREGAGAMTTTQLQSFPTQDTDLVKVFKDWLKIKPQFLKEYAAEGDAAVRKYRNNPAFAGRSVEEVLHDNAIFQELLPVKKFTGRQGEKMREAGFAPIDEYRIHAAGGRAHPGLALPRAPSGPLSTAKRYLVDARQANDWFQTEFLDKVPKEYRHLNYNPDVVRVGSGPKDFKIVELNNDQSSGLSEVPFLTHGFHKAFTGRYSKPAATLAGVAAGGAGLGLTGAVTNPSPKKERWT